MIHRAYQALYERYGEQHWWPATSRLEMMLGAVLTQNTSWTQVEKALATIRAAEALNLTALENAATGQIAAWIRSAGYYNQKARCIKEMVQAVRDKFDGSLDPLFALDTPTLRDELLSWRGIGPETADSILLYAAGRPVFVVDAYTKRVCARHGWIDEKASYDELAQLFTDRLPADPQLFNEYHALIVTVCKEHCHTKPMCAGCPLEAFL